MILSAAEHGLRVILQTDHAALSGALAAHWGNAVFRRPEPTQAMLLAAAEHDNGWREWEDRPRVNPTTRRPYQFTELPPEEHLELYWRGVERVIARDRYAGLMVSMHMEGLYNGRYGIDPTVTPPSLPPQARSIVQQYQDRLEAKQQQLREELRASAGLSAFLEPGPLWDNYKLLQVFDRLSLYVCMPPWKPSMLRPAPTGHRGGEAELSLRSADDGTVVVDPYPFDLAPLALSVPFRVVPPGPYAADEEFRQALADAPAQVLSCRFVRA